MECVSIRLECGLKSLLSPWVTNDRYYVMGWLTNLYFQKSNRRRSRGYRVFPFPWQPKLSAIINYCWTGGDSTWLNTVEIIQHCCFCRPKWWSARWLLAQIRRSGRDKVRFFRLPAVIQGQGGQTRSITEAQRCAWLKAISRDDLTTDKLANVLSVKSILLHVCAENV